jgi:acetyl-CoA carboxylase biotin carboxylase subunit
MTIEKQNEGPPVGKAINIEVSGKDFNKLLDITDEAINRMSRALEEYKITGVKTSIPFLAKIMEAEAFRSGKYNTHFIEENSEFLFGKPDCDGVCEDIALISAYLEYTSRLQQVHLSENVNKPTSRWKDPQRFAYI